MLKELLAEIAKADYLSKLALAQKLALPLSLIEDGYEQLIRLGYLKEDQGLQDCELPCGSCPYSKMCGQNPFKTVAITEKGRQFLQKQTLLT